MQNSGIKERRTFARFILPIPVSYNDPVLNKKINVKTHDISSNGIGLITDRAMTPGMHLDICLEMIDNGEKVYTQGKLIWSCMLEPGKYRAGFKIDDPKLRPIPLVLRTIKAKRKY